MGEQGLSPPVPLAICLCSALQFLLSGPLFLLPPASLVSLSQKFLEDTKVQIGARVTMVIINASFSDLRVSLTLIHILHSYDALCCTICSYEVGGAGLYDPDFGDRDTDRNCLTRRLLCMNINKTMN